MNKGRWNGKQIIPVEWIEYSTKPYNIEYKPAGLAYGVFWRVLMKTNSRSISSFYHTGAGVHMLGIYPKSNLVLVHRVQTEKEYDFKYDQFMQMIDKVWDSKKD